MMSAAGKNDGKKEFGEETSKAPVIPFYIFNAFASMKTVMRFYCTVHGSDPTHRVAINSTAYTSREPISVLRDGKIMVGTK